MSEILLVEDQTDAAKAIGTLIDWQGNNCVVAHSKAEAARAIEAVRFQVAIIDRGLPDGDGLDLIPMVRDSQPGCFVILFTGRPDNPDLRSVTGDPEAPDAILTKRIRSTQEILDLIAEVQSGESTSEL